MKKNKNLTNEYSIDSSNLLRSYIIDQPYSNTFPLYEALVKGVLFTNLYVPYDLATMENQLFKEDCHE